jgi:hypothetical protein
MTTNASNSNDDINSSKHLHTQDQNLRKALDLSSNQHTPAKFTNSLATPSSTTSSSSSTMTPSTTQKKQVQCAQQ